MNRTHIDGFGDRCSTVELYPYVVVIETNVVNLLQK